MSKRMIGLGLALTIIGAACGEDDHGGPAATQLVIHIGDGGSGAAEGEPVGEGEGAPPQEGEGTAGSCGVSALAHEGFLTLRAAAPCAGELAFAGPELSWRFGNGDLAVTSYPWPPAVEAVPLGLYQRQRLTRQGAPELLVTLRRQSGNAFRLEIEVSNPATAAVRILGLRIPAARSAAAGGWLNSGAGGNLNYLHQGYQSWSYTGVTELSPREAGLPELDELIAPGGNNVDVMGERLGISWWSLALTPAGTRNGAVAGALSARRWKTWLALAADGGEPVGVGLHEGLLSELDAVTVAPAASLAFEPWWLAWYEDVFSGLDDYAAAVAEEVAPLQWTGAVPRGWASWYEFFSGVTEAGVRGHIEVMAKDYAPLGYTLLQIDDGYEPAWGAWEADPEKFPSGLDGVAAEIATAGLAPGLWLAPFHVASALPVAQDHPDWFLREANGELSRYSNTGAGDYLILDVTHPQAAEWLQGEIAKLVGWGFVFLKIDFLFDEAREAVRHVPNVTTLEAYHRGLALIREAAGPDIFILACGAPFLPTVGEAHGYRTGPDIAYASTGKPYFRWLKSEIRQTAARAFTSQWFIQDPDQILVREPLTMGQARISAVANVLAGGELLLGDDLTKLPAVRAELLTDPWLLAINDAAAQPIIADAWEAATPQIIPTPVVDFDDANVLPAVWAAVTREHCCVALFNWREEGDAIWAIDESWLAGLGCGSSAEIWPAAAGGISHPLEVVVPAEDVVLVRFPLSAP